MATRVWLLRAARVALASCALVAAPSWSLGLGELKLQSYLNQPLSGTLEILDVGTLTADDIRIRLATDDDFKRLGVDRSFFLTSISFELTIDPARGSGSVLLSSEEPVTEPYIDLVVEARWPTGRLLREYTVLVDPPVFRTEIVTVSASERVRQTESPAAPATPAATGGDQATSATPTSGQIRRVASDLPPGEMPRREFSAETADRPRAGSRYLVKRDETLWEIALSGRPEGIPVQQAMLDIQRLNPEAFINGNINRVKAGYIIYLPDADDISSGSLAAALEEVRVQNADFEAQRAAPGVTAAATLRVSALPSVAADNAAATGQGDSDASSSQGTGPAPAAGSGAPAASASADAGRVAALTERLDTLEQIVALKDQEIANLQQALLEARRAAAEASAAAEVAPATAPPADSADTSPAQIAEATAPIAAPDSAIAPAVDAEPAAGAVTTSPPTVSNDPTTAPPAGTSPSLGSLPLIPIAGVVAVLLGLLTLGMLRLRRRSVATPEATEESGEDVFAGVNLIKDALDPAQEALAPVAAEPEVPTEPAPSPPPGAEEDSSGSRGYGEKRHDDYIDEAGGDALAEADIYIAYGRYLQAIELLNTAIESAPSNSAYRLKLLELYIDMGELDNAQEQFAMLREQGDNECIARAEQLLGSAAGTASVEQAATAPSARPTTPPVDELARGLADTAPPIAPVPAPSQAPASSAAVVDLPSEIDQVPQVTDIEDGLPPLPEVDSLPAADSDIQGEGSNPFVSTSTSADISEPLEFDMPVAPAAEPVESPASTDSASDAVHSRHDDDMSIDYEPDAVGDLAANSPISPLAPERASEDDLLGFELAEDADGADGEFQFEELQIEDDDLPAPPSVGFQQIDDSGDELDLRDAFSSVDTAPAVEEEELLVADDSDQMATKLDLARAYLDMDDSEGARVILEEVVAAGSGDQQQEARELLARLG